MTGGPVHAHLDAVKIVTNRFRGGLMAQLAENLACRFDCEVTYLTAKDARHPRQRPNLRVLLHDGFFDYRDQVLALAPAHTDVVLGAAVANLVPQNPWPGKFPSHDYFEGDVVSIPFLVAPRVITQVKRVAPHVNLFGFKLLSAVPRQELVDAAYGIVLDAHATAVIANDAEELLLKHVVTRERGVHTFAMGPGLEDFLWQLMTDQHYQTQLTAEPGPAAGAAEVLDLAQRTHAQRPGFFVEVHGGLLFGTVAQRVESGGFWTTGRGKHELSQAVYVRDVDHVARVVRTHGPQKATLNAPLLDALFAQMPELQTIVHGHVQDAGLPTLPYAQPGTVRDSLRQPKGSFNVQDHGCFLLYDHQGQLLRWPQARSIGPVPETEWATIDRILNRENLLQQTCGTHVSEEKYAFEDGLLYVDRTLGDGQVLAMRWELA